MAEEVQIAQSDASAKIRNPLGVVANFTPMPRGYRYYTGSSPSDQPA